MRPNEEYCKEAYDRYLALRFPALPRRWVPTDPAADYCVTLGQTVLSVEVTQVFDVETRLVPRPLGVMQLASGARRLAQEAQSILANTGDLSGTYALTILPMDDFQSLRKQIVRAICAYVRRTREASSAPEESLVPYPSLATISKLRPSGAEIYECTALMKWPSDVSQVLRDQVRQAIAKKANARRCDPHPVVLLLYDQYPYGRADWHAAVSDLSIPAPFVSILRIHGDAEAHLLWEDTCFWQSQL